MRRCSLTFTVALAALLTATSTFAGDPAAVARRLMASPRITIDAAEPAPAAEGAVKVTFSFNYLDPRGKPQVGHGKITMPAAVLSNPSRRVPLYYGAGYETADDAAAGYIHDGFAAASPLKTKVNPVARTPNLDIALLHILRTLPFVDDAKVTIAGGSAGGYTTLMLAAETFPLAGAVPLVAPVNLGYQFQYILSNYPLIRGIDGKRQGSPVPILAGIHSLVIPDIFEHYPQDVGAPMWSRNSPLAHLETITCPVLAVWSTGDTLVPIHQVSRKLVRPHDPSLYPEGFKIEPAELMRSESGRAELLASLREDPYTLTIVPADRDWPIESEVRKTGKRNPLSAPRWEIPFTGSRQWEIVVLDEGPIMPASGHFLHHILPADDRYIRDRVAAPISPDQLTPRKLERLMARYSGVEWLDSGLRQLDYPEAERADVLRGLLTYVTQGEGHARRFVELYAALPTDRRALGARFSDPATIASALRAIGNQ